MQFEEIWEKPLLVCMVRSVEGYFTSMRVDRDSVPDGVYLYEIRHDEKGNCCQVKEGIMIDFYGSLFTMEPLNFIGQDEGYVKEGEDFVFTERRKKMKDIVDVVKLVLTEKQAEKLADIILTHMENSRKAAGIVNSPRVTKAVEKECQECGILLERITGRKQENGSD